MRRQYFLLLYERAYLGFRNETRLISDTEYTRIICTDMRKWNPAMSVHALRKWPRVTGDIILEPCFHALTRENERYTWRRALLMHVRFSKRINPASSRKPRIPLHRIMESTFEPYSRMHAPRICDTCLSNAIQWAEDLIRKLKRSTVYGILSIAWWIQMFFICTCFMILSS